MNTLYFILIVFILLELFESSWQKAETLYGVMNNNYVMFQKNIFTFILLNPTFIYSLFISFYLGLFNFWMSSIVIVKFVDIAFRLHIINKMKDGNELSSIIPVDIPMSNLFRYINVIIYPLTLIFALKLI